MPSFSEDELIAAYADSLHHGFRAEHVIAESARRGFSIALVDLQRLAGIMQRREAIRTWRSSSTCRIGIVEYRGLICAVAFHIHRYVIGAFVELGTREEAHEAGLFLRPDRTNHALERAQERYGIVLDKYDLAKICGMIRGGSAQHVRDDANNRRVYDLVYRDTVMRVVYDAKRNWIATFLPLSGFSMVAFHHDLSK